jgi:peptidoglycan hydrolase-like protein with peptidoglycan-binding domain
MKRSLLCLVVTLCAVSLVHADQTIRSLQQTLKDQGFYYGTVTGEKSAETTAAIRRYQIRKGLKVTGEINEETSHSLNANSNSVAAVSRPSSKPTAPQVNSVRPATTSPSFSQTSPRPSSRQIARPLEPNPAYATSFYQPAPPLMNRQTIAEAQYQLMRGGYYRGRVDGSYGPQTAFGLRAFQSRPGLVPTGRLDMQTLNALGLSDTSLGYAAPAPNRYETWVSMRKFKHGKWKVKWKKYDRPWGSELFDEDRQANTVYGWQRY